MNVTDQDQMLGGGTIIGNGQPTVWASNLSDQKREPRRKRGLGPQPREWLAPNQT
jgi:hypothetical protein